MTTVPDTIVRLAIGGLGIGEIIGLIGGATISGGTMVVIGSGIVLAYGSARLLQFIKDRADQYAEAVKSKDGGEGTPAVPRGRKFEKKRICNTTVYERDDGDLFVEDLTHLEANSKALPHYEVYKNDKDLGKRKRNRSVTWDGKRMETFF